MLTFAFLILLQNSFLNQVVDTVRADHHMSKVITSDSLEVSKFYHRAVVNLTEGQNLVEFKNIHHEALLATLSLTDTSEVKPRKLWFRYNSENTIDLLFLFESVKRGMATIEFSYLGDYVSWDPEYELWVLTDSTIRINRLASVSNFTGTDINNAELILKQYFDPSVKSTSLPWHYSYLKGENLFIRKSIDEQGLIRGFTYNRDGRKNTQTYVGIKKLGVRSPSRDPFGTENVAYKLSNLPSDTLTLYFQSLVSPISYVQLDLREHGLELDIYAAARMWNNGRVCSGCGPVIISNRYRTYSPHFIKNEEYLYLHPLIRNFSKKPLRTYTSEKPINLEYFDSEQFRYMTDTLSFKSVNVAAPAISEKVNKHIRFEISDPSDVLAPGYAKIHYSEDRSHICKLRSEPGINEYLVPFRSLDRTKTERSVISTVSRIDSTGLLEFTDTEVSLTVSNSTKDTLQILLVDGFDHTGVLRSELPYSEIPDHELNPDKGEIRWNIELPPDSAQKMLYRLQTVRLYDQNKN